MERFIERGRIAAIALPAVFFSMAAAVLHASVEVNDVTGLWRNSRTGCRRLHDTMDRILSEIPARAAMELDHLLGASCLFARRVSIAQLDESLTIIGDDRRSFFVPISAERNPLSEARSRLRRRPGKRAYFHDGFLVVEQRGRFVTVRSTFAKVSKGPLLCRAVTVRIPGCNGERPFVIRQVLSPAENRERLPNPWKEPPSILPPPSKRRVNPIKRGIQDLVNLGRMAVPFL